MSTNELFDLSDETTFMPDQYFQTNTELLSRMAKELNALQSVMSLDDIDLLTQKTMQLMADFNISKSSDGKLNVAPKHVRAGNDGYIREHLEPLGFAVSNQDEIWQATPDFVDTKTVDHLMLAQHIIDYATVLVAKSTHNIKNRTQRSGSSTLTALVNPNMSVQDEEILQQSLGALGFQDISILPEKEVIESIYKGPTPNAKMVVAKHPDYIYITAFAMITANKKRQLDYLWTMAQKQANNGL